MDEHNLQSGNARSLADVLGLGGDEQPLWRPEELAAMLRHQLAAPLEFDLSFLDIGPAQRLPTLTCAEGSPIRTFGELLRHAEPPVELLKLTKEFAKKCQSRPDGPLPDEIATILYVLSIAAALVRCGSRITRLDDEVLRHTLQWALGQPWLDEQSRALLDETSRTLETAGDGAGDATPSNRASPHFEPSVRPDMSVRAPPPLGQLGEYKLQEKLGEGGMGAVYKAIHTELDRTVALKVIRRGRLDDPWAVARFQREIKAAGRLDHPNIVRAHDARKIGDVQFLVMEYVDGLDLTELSRRLGPLPPADACELIRQAALGLACAHEHGLVHRDIKPSNLILSRAGQVKILDLGLARVPAEAGGQAPSSAVAVEAMTEQGQAMGTPDYMAPEQVADTRTADHRADIYSLGCTLYKLLGGQPPFSGPRYSTAFEKMTAHVREPAPPISELRTDLPGELVALLERMLAKQPEERPASAAKVAEQMARFTSGCDLLRLVARAEATDSSAEPPAAVGTPGTPRSAATTRPGHAPARRKHLPLIAAGVLTAVIVVGLLVAIVGRSGRPERDAAETPADGDAADGRGAASGAVRPADLPGWIVLSWSRPRLRLSRPELWLFSPDGKRRKQLTNDPRYYDVQPCFSPDGRRIAFLRGQDPLRPNGIWVCNADGSNLRQVVAAKDDSERLASPVWVSKSWLYYSRDPKPDRAADAEVWAVEIDAREPRQVFRLRDTLGKGMGLVTSISPDGQQLAVIAQTAGSSATADVYVTDLQGRRLHALWEDRPDEYKDARALWSPDGTRIAWHHNFAAGTAGKTIPYGVGIAGLGRDNKWSSRLQPEHNTLITPLAWSPHGKCLLCARVHDSGEKVPPVTLLLMDDQFREVCTLFDLEVSHWDPAQRDLGRTADWAIVPGGATPVTP